LGLLSRAAKPPTGRNGGRSGRLHRGSIGTRAQYFPAAQSDSLRTTAEASRTTMG